jgi:putative SOS response-associated peptidase YedK
MSPRPDQLPIVRFNPTTKARTLHLMRWGLVPYWAKDIKVGFSTINAMSEMIDTKPVFREAFKRRSCLVPVEAYYERMARPVRKRFRDPV